MNIAEEFADYCLLLELISPDGGEIFHSDLDDILQETGGLPPLILLKTIALEKALFACEENDLSALISQIRKLAAFWQANVFSAADNEEEESVLYDFDFEDLLHLAARELYLYDLSLWQIESDLWSGFIARASDDDLLLNAVEKLKLKIEKVSI